MLELTEVFVAADGCEVDTGTAGNFSVRTNGAAASVLLTTTAVLLSSRLALLLAESTRLSSVLTLAVLDDRSRARCLRADLALFADADWPSSSVSEIISKLDVNGRSLDVRFSLVAVFLCRSCELVFFSCLECFGFSRSLW